MEVYVHKQLVERWVSKGVLDKHYSNHTLPFRDVEYIPIDFQNQDKSNIKYPLFPFMTLSAYNNRAENLNAAKAGHYGSSDDVIGWIDYSLSNQSVREPEPRIIKMRKHADIPVIKRLGLGDDFGELIVTNLQNDIISYYLIDNTSNKIDRNFDRAIYNLDGTPINKNSFTWKMFQRDDNAVKMVNDYFSRQGNDDDTISEAFAPPKSITNRFGKVIGYLSVDRSNGDQMIQDRFGAIKGWYRSFSDTTVDRFGRVVGFGNLLTTLLDINKMNESKEKSKIKMRESRHNDVESLLEECIVDILNYLDNNNIEFPQHRYLFDDWNDWLTEYEYNSQNLGELLEDTVIFEEVLSSIDDTHAQMLLNKLQRLHQRATAQSESLRILETKTSRIYTHIVENPQWAIVSPYRSEYDEEENQQRMSKLKADARNLGYGFIQFISRWVENNEAFDEESLLIPKMSKDEAISLGKKYNQSSVIVCDNNKAQEICTTPFEDHKDGETVRTFNLSGDKPLNINDAEAIFAKRKGGPVSKTKYGKAKPFTLKEVYEIEGPRASYFQKTPRVLKILESVK